MTEQDPSQFLHMLCKKCGHCKDMWCVFCLADQKRRPIWGLPLQLITEVERKGKVYLDGAGREQEVAGPGRGHCPSR